MMGGYVVGFIALFLLSGIGNGSVYKMIPSIFEASSRSLDVSEADRVAWSRAMSGALIGFAGAIGALGGVGINLALRQSYLTSHSATIGVLDLPRVLCGGLRCDLGHVRAAAVGCFGRRAEQVDLARA